MVLYLLAASLSLPLRAQVSEVWTGRPPAAHAPAALDAPGLDRLFDNAAGGLEVAPAPAAAASRAGRVRFNGAEFPAAAFPRQRSVTDLLVKAIDRSEASIRLVLYEFNQAKVLEALQRAASRTPPVQIQILLDSSHAFPFGRSASAEVQALLADPRMRVRVIRGLDQYGTNHNKFGIFDSKMVEYGSYNWTNAGEGKNFENALFSAEQARIARFYAYFEWSWKLSSPATGPAPIPDLPPPPADPAPAIPFNGRLLPAVVFSPRGGTSAWLREAIAASERSIDVAMFSFFDQSLADALLERKRKGLAIRLVLDRAQGMRSPVVKFIKENGFDARLSQGRGGAGVMHHKFALFDRKLLETGSHNWTNNAELNNFENTSFLADAGLVASFQEEFEAVWSQGVELSSLPDDSWAPQNQPGPPSNP